MPIDNDIFGAPAAQRQDSDIFKDSAPAKEEAAPVAPPAKPRQKVYGGDWGMGFAPAMENLGTKLAVATGSPQLGAAAGAIGSVIPDAIQMITGGGVGKGVGEAVSPVTGWLSNWLMRSALKPTVQMGKNGKAEAAAETMLREGANPTAGGVDKLKGILGDLGEQVRNSVSGSGATVDAHAVADYVPNAYERFKNGPLAVQAINDLGNVQAGFLSHPNIAGARDIPVQLAQDMKTGYQRAIGDKGYGELKTPGTEGEKQIARGLRELVGQAVPEVTAPLAREASIIQALKMAERRVAVDSNKNPLGLGALITQPWMVPVWMWDRSALAKGLTARALYPGQGYVPGTFGAAGALYSGQQPGALYSSQ